VTDSLGIFNTAPRGVPMGIAISGPSWVLAGTEHRYSYKGYDSHYYPWQPGVVEWQIRGDGSVNHGLFTAGKGGEVVLEATSGAAKGTKNIHVIGAAEIKGLKATPASIKLANAAPITLNFSVQTYDGAEFPLEAQYVTLGSDCGTVSSGGVFTPFDERSRGVITINYQGLTLEIPVRSGSLFSDTTGHWADEPINELADAGIINGFDDGTYRPGDQVTRAQIVTLLARQAGWTLWENTAIFSDPIPDWAAGSVTAAAARGVVSGYPDNTFQPNRSITRAEVSVILDKAFSLPYASGTTSFSDAAQIPAWASESMNRVVAAGYMRGYEDNTVRPGASLTRAEIAVLMKRIQDAEIINRGQTPPPLTPVTTDPVTTEEASSPVRFYPVNEPPEETVDSRIPMPEIVPPTEETSDGRLPGIGIWQDGPPDSSENPMSGGLRPLN
ncbi:MAG: S-layer homology domain-containing protein, partial [Peptococcaceae bacterium]|nr:S-layer homology domain-containing protein [Peptococcaceae bacterium]